MQVRELAGVDLDWAVAKAEGRIDDYNSWLHEATPQDIAGSGNYHPSTDWAQGGPIIEREDIAIFPGVYVTPMFWCAMQDKGGTQPMALEDLDGRSAWWFEEREVITGPTPLVAAMRCYVASKLGNEIEVPREAAIVGNLPQ